jgi:hypothetical protein
MSEVKVVNAVVQEGGDEGGILERGIIGDQWNGDEMNRDCNPGRVHTKRCNRSEEIQGKMQEENAGEIQMNHIKYPRAQHKRKPI